MINKLTKLNWIYYAYLLILPILFAIYKIYIGDISFWYDIARDFLLAEGNLIKPTLIGPPSGIPGIFYGPYWIWLLSGGLLISRDPRLVSGLLAGIPYLIIFPLLLIPFFKIFNKKHLILLWFLFITGFNFYATNLWNPQPSALIILLIIILVVFKNFHKNIYLSKIYILLLGFLAGLLMNFHISLGMGMITGLFIYLMYDLFKHIRKLSINNKVFIFILTVIPFVIGIALALIPFFAFEFRHGFLQIKAFLDTLKSGFLYNSAVVGETGLTKIEIVENLFSRLSIFLHLPKFIAFAIYGIILGAIIALQRNNTLNVKFSEKEFKIIILPFFIGIGIILMYFLTKNPVWDYHFLGIEVFLFFLLAIVMKKSELFSKVIFYWVLIVSVFLSIQFLNSFKTNYAATNSTSLASVTFIVNSIYKDAGNNSFGYFAQSPSIYTFEFDYIFKFQSKKNNLKMAVKDSINEDYVYLIIPKSTDKDHLAYIENKTPLVNFKIIKVWDNPDYSKIYKMQKIK